jgi:hypothetical protein
LVVGGRYLVVGNIDEGLIKTGFCMVRSPPRAKLSGQEIGAHHFNLKHYWGALYIGLIGRYNNMQFVEEVEKENFNE